MKNLIKAEKCLKISVKDMFEILNNVNTADKNELYYRSFIKRFFMFYPSYFGHLNNVNSAPVLWQEMAKAAKEIRIQSPSNEACILCERKYRNTIKTMLTAISQTGDDIPQQWLRNYYIATMQTMKFITKEELQIASERESNKKEFLAVSEYLENQLVQEVQITKTAKGNMDIRKSVERTLHIIYPLWVESRDWIVDIDASADAEDEIQPIEMNDEVKRTFQCFVNFRNSITKADIAESKEEINTNVFSRVLPKPVIMAKNCVGYVNARDIVYALTGIKKEI